MKIFFFEDLVSEDSAAFAFLLFSSSLEFFCQLFGRCQKIAIVTFYYSEQKCASDKNLGGKISRSIITVTVGTFFSKTCKNGTLIDLSPATARPTMTTATTTTTTTTTLAHAQVTRAPRDVLKHRRHHLWNKKRFSFWRSVAGATVFIQVLLLQQRTVATTTTVTKNFPQSWKDLFWKTKNSADYEAVVKRRKFSLKQSLV